MILSKICSYFSYKDCTFGIEWYKQSSARAIIWDMLKSTNIFCVETSFHGYMHKGSVEQFHPSDLFKLGQSILRAIYLDQVQEDCQLFAFTRQQCVDEIEQQRATDQEAGYDKDSGSDSDPLADELNIKEKIKSFIPETIAKQAGMLPRSFRSHKRNCKSIDTKSEKKKQRSSEHSSRSRIGSGKEKMHLDQLSKTVTQLSATTGCIQRPGAKQGDNREKGAQCSIDLQGGYSTKARDCETQRMNSSTSECQQRPFS